MWTEKFSKKGQQKNRKYICVEQIQPEAIIRSFVTYTHSQFTCKQIFYKLESNIFEKFCKKICSSDWKFQSKVCYPRNSYDEYWKLVIILTARDYYTFLPNKFRVYRLENSKFFHLAIIINRSTFFMGNVKVANIIITCLLCYDTYLQRKANLICIKACCMINLQQKLYECRVHFNLYLSSLDSFFIRFSVFSFV